MSTDVMRRLLEVEVVDVVGLLNVVSGPSTISPFAPIVYSPRRPALNFSPSLPVIRPEASAAAAWPAR